MDRNLEHDEFEYSAEIPIDIELEEDRDRLSHRKRVRQMLEERLERKRLQEELDEFDWDDYES
jgi:hypothetical protein